MSSGPTSRRTSFAWLSLLCFALADVRDGLGPFLGVWLQSLGWTPDAIGHVMTAGGLAGLACTTPLGALADRTRYKRLMLACSVAAIVFGCAVLLVASGPFVVTLSKVAQGAAAASLTPLLTAITLGMTGQKGLVARLGVNEAFSHAGNMATALASGLVGYVWGFQGVLLVMSLMGAVTVFALCRINPAHIDHSAASGLRGDARAENPECDARDGEGGAVRLRDLFSNRALLATGAILFFFHLGNAAMLPLLGQSAVARFDVNPAVYTACTVVLAQATMIITALWGARKATERGCGVLFFLALAALPVRGLVAGLWDSPWSILPVQILDGVGAGLLGVATPGVVARLLAGSGRVNTGLGFALTLQGVGASLSNSYGGLFAHHMGYATAFFALALAPCAGLLLLVAAVRAYPNLRRAVFVDAPR